MQKVNPTLIYRLLNLWIAFIGILFVSSYLPHWANVSYHTWINETAYFMIFLLSIAITKIEKHNKDIFINLSILTFCYSFSFINIFIGDKYLFGNAYTQYYVFHYKKTILTLLFNFNIIYLAVKYLLLRKYKIRTLYIITTVLILPVFLMQFFPYLADAHRIFSLGSLYRQDLSQRIFIGESFALVYVILYGFKLYKKDAILGEYINPLMASFFIFLVSNMINNLSIILHINIFSIGQYILTFNLLSLTVILLKKLCFLSSDYGQFYESLTTQKISLGKLKIQRQHSEINSLLVNVLKNYFYFRRNYILGVFFITGVSFSYLEFPKFFIINFAALTLCFAILFWFINALYRRRAKHGFIVPSKGADS